MLEGVAIGRKNAVWESNKGNMWTDPAWEHINRSQTHECGPSKEIHKWDFPCSALFINHKNLYRQVKILKHRSLV